MSTTCGRDVGARRLENTKTISGELLWVFEVVVLVHPNHAHYSIAPAIWVHQRDKKRASPWNFGSEYLLYHIILMKILPSTSRKPTDSAILFTEAQINSYVTSCFENGMIQNALCNGSLLLRHLSIAKRIKCSHHSLSQNSFFMVDCRLHLGEPVKV